MISTLHHLWQKPTIILILSISLLVGAAAGQFAHTHLLEDEGLEPHTVQELWLIGGPEANDHVETTDTIDAKIEALLCHESQIAEPEQMAKRIAEWGAEQGKRVGLNDGCTAERFRVIKTV